MMRKYPHATVRSIAIFVVMVVLLYEQQHASAQQTIVVLKNGNVLQGIVQTRQAKYIIKTDGNSLAIDRDTVQFTASSMQEAFNKRCAASDPENPEHLLDNFRWSIRHGMIDEAEKLTGVMADLGIPAAQLATAERQLATARSRHQQSENGGIDSFERPKTTDEHSSGNNKGPTVKEIEHAIHKLPKGTLQNFNKLIQPELVHGCTAAGCHSGQGEEFEFWRKNKGQKYPRRFSQNNLYQIIQNVDLDQPDESLFLKMARSAHGGAEAPVFDSESRDYQLLRYWVFSMSKHPENFYLKTEIKTESPQSTKPAQESESAPVRDSNVAKTVTEKIPTPPSTDDLTSENIKVTSDPYDPEIFNRKFHPKKTIKK